MDQTEQRRVRERLQAELDSLDAQIWVDDPYSHPERFDRNGVCTDMTGQPPTCDQCGAPYKRSGAYLLCTKGFDHWRFTECTDEVRRAVEERWGNQKANLK